MPKPIPYSGSKTLLDRVFFNRFVLKVTYCAAGHQSVTRKNEYIHDHISWFTFALFDPDTQTYDDGCQLTGIVFFRFFIVIADLKKIEFRKISNQDADKVESQA